jgi:Ca2+/Na+ antiporter
MNNNIAFILTGVAVLLICYLTKDWKLDSKDYLLALIFYQLLCLEFNKE